MKKIIILILLIVSINCFGQNTFNGKNTFNDTTTITTMGGSDSSNRAASTAWVKRQGFGSGSTPTLQQVTTAGNTSTNLLKYSGNYGGSYDARTLVDKNYVDSARNKARDSVVALIPSISGVQTLSSQYTDASNSGTSETDLMSYTVSSGQLVNNGDRLEIEGWFIYAANANTKTLKFKFGAYSTTIASSFVTSSGGSVKFRIVVTRTGAATQKIAYEFRPEFGTLTQGFSAGSETLSGTVVTKFTGTSNTASNDIVQKTMTVVYHSYTP